MYLSKHDIEKMDRIKRLNIINSIAGIKPANMIGTANKNKQTNLAIFSSVMHLGSSPALMGFILRPEGDVIRNTYENIKKTGVFTINHVSEDHTAQAHATSAKFPAEDSEFAVCNFTEQWLSSFKAPFVQESHLKIGLSFVESIPIKINNTSLVIGQVEHLFIENNSISQEGYINLGQINSVGVGGLNTYYTLKKQSSYPYARVNGHDDS